MNTKPRDIPASESLRLLALDAGAEDWTGLYELIWSANRVWPNASTEVKIAAAISAVLDLLRSGYLEFRRNRWTTRESERIPDREAEAIVAESASYEPPDSNGLFIEFACTLAGQGAYQAIPETEFKGLL